MKQHWWHRWRQPSRNDASTLVGMQTTGAYAFALAVIGGCAWIGLAAGGVTSPGLFLVVIVLDASALLALLAAPGDPLDWRVTVVTAALPSGALLLSMAATTPRPGMADAVVMGLLAFVLAFMCVRGRLWSAWGGFGLSLVVIGLGQQIFGTQPTVVAAILPNTAVLLMATFFAAIVRPRAKQVYALREQTQQRSAAAAAQEAAILVRSQQLSYLDQQARPLLELIADGHALDDGVVEQCSLVAAALRDRIRAPGLDSPSITEGVWQARARGARVVLLDDRRTGSPEEPALFRSLQRVAVAALESAQKGGEVTVRLLPAGRDLLATVMVNGPEGRRLCEFGHDGQPIGETAASGPHSGGVMERNH